jgi:tRNA modification GTPase
MGSHRKDFPECIIAQCTPHGPGALALIRISGPSVRSLVEKMARLASKMKISEVPSHTIHYGSVGTDGSPIDNVMFIVMDSPRTFTGENVIEITCHNNPLIIEAIISSAIAHGARLAQPGEFTRRAFEQGKIDLIQAESIHELISAQTQQALKLSLAQLEGSFSHWIEELQQELLQALAWCEASFEFLDEEREFGTQIQARIGSLLSTITSLKQTFSAQQQLRQGIKIALIGSVNAGKSSLFNALVSKERAIVTDIPGTTRDSIEEGISVLGNQWTIVDTAGLRTTEDLIEQEGIKRSLTEAHKADLVLLVIDGSRDLSPQEYQAYTSLRKAYPTKCILVQTKADCPRSSHNELLKDCSLVVSAKTGINIDQLISAIKHKNNELFAALDSPFLLNKRQHSLLLALEQKLTTINNELTSHPQYELISVHLQEALTTLSELTGKTISEAGLDRVFKEFCVGK